MPTKYFCAHCDEEFFPEDSAGKPRCPRCMRKGGVEPVQQQLEPPSSSRRWVVVAAIALVVAGVGYGVYRSQTVALEETPPLRPNRRAKTRAKLVTDHLFRCRAE